MPPQLTALTEHPRRPGRYVAVLDGTPVGALSVEAIATLKLQVGEPLDAERLEALHAAVRVTTCHDKALDALARRARARGELARWLRDREFTAAEIDPVLDRLTTLGLLDDRAFARSFVHSRMTARAYGPRRVAAELGRRGVDRRLIDEVLAEFRAEQERDADRPLGADGDAADAPVARAAATRLRALRDLDPMVARRRLVGWLARRGFELGESLRTAKRLLPDRGTGALD
ncbi:MAG: hypothetical protein RL139_857 [Gemmatimonadota bacterium]